MDDQDGYASADDAPKDSSDARPMIYTSDELMQGCREAWIEHNGQMYRLRVTSKGNLILTR